MNSRAWSRRGLTWCAVAGYALLASGLPLPAGLAAPRRDGIATTRLAAKDRSQPFPCMDKPCGCATAEQCFANCCCHTPAERLAWAKAHGVEQAVLAALQRRVAADSAAAGSCCTATPKRKQACCGGTADAAAVTADRPPAPSDDSSAPSVRIRTVTLRAMLACGGMLGDWLAVGGGLPPPRLDLVLDTPLVDRRPLGDHSGELLASPPDAPPPRSA